MIPNEENVPPHPREFVGGYHRRMPTIYLDFVFTTNDSPPKCICLSAKFPPPFKKQASINIPDSPDAQAPLGNTLGYI